MLHWVFIAIFPNGSIANQSLYASSSLLEQWAIMWNSNYPEASMHAGGAMHSALGHTLSWVQLSSHPTTAPENRVKHSWAFHTSSFTCSMPLSDLISCSVIAILKFLIFAQGAPLFHFALGPTNCLADPNYIIGLHFIIYPLKSFAPISGSYVYLLILIVDRILMTNQCHPWPSTTFH